MTPSHRISPWKRARDSRDEDDMRIEGERERGERKTFEGPGQRRMIESRH
jgi:hypothetical protein